jgi:predicted exporter
MNSSGSAGFRKLAPVIRFRFFAWSAFVAALLIVFLFRVLPTLKIETDILALLPSAQQDSAIDDALDGFAARLARKQLFLIGARTPEAAKSAAGAFAKTLAASDAFARIDFEINADLQQSLAVYLAHPRQALCSPSDLRTIRSDS